jgi:hypothetical protein
MKALTTIFFTGFMQVFLVGANTYFSSRTADSGMAALPSIFQSRH